MQTLREDAPGLRQVRMSALAALVTAGLAATATAQNSGLDWGSYLGAGFNEIVAFPNGLWMTSNEEPIVCGTTTSPNFPVTLPTPYQRGGDAFNGVTVSLF